MMVWIHLVKKNTNLKIISLVSFYLLMWLLENFKCHIWVTLCFYCTAMQEETHSSMGVIIIKEKMRT